MEVDEIIESISRGRTEYIFELFKQPNWTEILHEGQIQPLQWLVHNNDTTALKAV